jgi:hypothetical protein
MRNALHDHSLLAQFDDATKQLEENAIGEREPQGSARAGSQQR